MESLAEINHYDAGRFEKWLQQGFQAKYNGDSRSRYAAFDFRRLGIPKGESHIDALTGLFGRLDESAKDHFRDSLGLLLRHAQPGGFPDDAMSDVVLLSGLTQAYSAFDAFSSVLGSGPWGELHPHLFYDALSVLLMFDRTDEAYQATKALATSAHFPDAYVFDAFMVMVRGKPENWRNDLATFRDRILRVRTQIGMSTEPRKLATLQRKQEELAQSLAQTIPLSVLAEQLPFLNYEAPSAIHSSTDDWLLLELCGIRGPLALQDDSDLVFLSDKSDPARRNIIVSPVTPSTFLVICMKNNLFCFVRPNAGPTNPEDILPEKTARLLKQISGQGGFSRPRHTSGGGSAHGI